MMSKMSKMSKMSEISSLVENREVNILRRGVHLKEWTESNQGVALAEKKRKFMASYAGNSKEIETKFFYEFVALCEDSDLRHMARLLQQQQQQQKLQWVQPSRFIYPCIAEASILGDKKCLEMCLEMWDYLSSLHDQGIEPKKLEIMVILDFVEVQNLKGMHASTFDWLSSKWSNNTILNFVDNFPLPYCYFPHLGDLFKCCKRWHKNWVRQTSQLMSFFSYSGSLKGVQWLDEMGVQSLSAIVNAILGGHTDILEYLLSKHTISMCDVITEGIINRCSYEMLVWCFDNNLIRCSSVLIHLCSNHIKLQDLVERGAVVTQDDIYIAALQLNIACLRVLCRASKRWNPSNFIVKMQEKIREATTHVRKWDLENFCQTYELPITSPKIQTYMRVQRSQSFVYDWCRQMHLPVQRWNSLESVQHVVYKGEVDQDGVMLRRVVPKMVCSGRTNVPCSYSPIGNSTSTGPTSHEWMCNSSRLCSCGNRFGRRHSI